MLTQKQINERWTVRCDNYNRYVEKEFATDRPEKWLHIIRNHLRVYGKWLEDFKTESGWRTSKLYIPLAL